MGSDVPNARDRWSVGRQRHGTLRGKMKLRNVYVLVLLIAFGCDSDGSSDETPMADAEVMMPDQGVDAMVEPLPLPEMGRWETIYPGGDTICSRGTDFRFYLRGGDPSKVMIYFQGGGACWDDLTCSIADANFSDRVTEPEDFNAFAGFSMWAFLTRRRVGLQRLHAALHSILPGDVHWGDKPLNTRMTLPFIIEAIRIRRLHSNTCTAGFRTFEVFVTGCSAGRLWAALNSIVAPLCELPDGVLADSGSGIITDTFLNDSFRGTRSRTCRTTWNDSRRRCLRSASKMCISPFQRHFRSTGLPCIRRSLITRKPSSTKPWEGCSMNGLASSERC